MYVTVFAQVENHNTKSADWIAPVSRFSISMCFGLAAAVCLDESVDCCCAEAENDDRYNCIADVCESLLPDLVAETDCLECAPETVEEVLAKSCEPDHVKNYHPTVLECSVEQEVSLLRQIKTDTGATFTSTSIMLFDREIGARTPDFENYRVSEKITSIAQIGIPIFTVERTYYEQNITTQSITCEQAMEEVKPHLLQQLDDMLPVEASDISFYLDETKNGVLIGVSAVTSEDIALFKAKE